MIVDVTGVILIPGDGGEACPGNGTGKDEQGQTIECCCDECDYLLCCIEKPHCECCQDRRCPRAKQ